MTTKISQWQRIALLAAGVSASMVPAACGQNLYQTHTDGTIWEYTGVPCDRGSCPGWIELDNNPNLKMIAAGGGALFELHNDGSIWWYVGPACSGGSCPGWVELDNNPLALTIGVGGVGNNIPFEKHQDGSLWEYNGTICTGGFCPGWTELNGPVTGGVPLYAANGTALVAQMPEEGGGTTLFQYAGTPFDWQIVFDDTTASVAVDGGGVIYALDPDGAVYVQGALDWFKLDNIKAANVAAGGGFGNLYAQRKSHTIWQFTGQFCGHMACDWVQIDDNRTSEAPVAGSTTAYQIRHDPTASIWQYTGTPCSGTVCSGWVKLDHNAATNSIVAGPTTF